MKKTILGVLMVLMFAFSGCMSDTPDQTLGSDYRCKDTPLAEGCYIPSEDLNFISPTPDEYTISETFETERVGQMPRNWLLYRNEEYAADGVKATIVEGENNKYVEMKSDGLKAPMYPQSAPTPTFIFSTKFNLDIDRKGVAYASLMLPSDKKASSISLGVTTGAVNTISVVIGTDLKVKVKVGGPFFYYSGTADGGDEYQTPYTLEKDMWYTFKYEWDASLNQVSAYMKVDETFILLYQGAFHISNRVNALSNGSILVPNIFKVTMPRGSAGQGFGYLDNVLVERKG